MKKSKNSVFFVIIRDGKILFSLSKEDVWTLPGAELIETENSDTKMLFEKEISEQIPDGVGLKNVSHYATLKHNDGNVIISYCDLCLKEESKKIGSEPVAWDLAFDLILNKLDDENKVNEANYSTHWIDVDKINMKLSGISEEIINQLSIEKVNQKFNQS